MRPASGQQPETPETFVGDENISNPLCCFIPSLFEISVIAYQFRTDISIQKPSAFPPCFHDEGMLFFTIAKPTSFLFPYAETIDFKRP
jgi:hypothetical protein